MNKIKLIFAGTLSVLFSVVAFADGKNWLAPCVTAFPGGNDVLSESIDSFKILDDGKKYLAVGIGVGIIKDGNVREAVKTARINAEKSYVEGIAGKFSVEMSEKYEESDEASISKTIRKESGGFKKIVKSFALCGLKVVEENGEDEGYAVVAVSSRSRPFAGADSENLNEQFDDLEEFEEKRWLDVLSKHREIWSGGYCVDKMNGKWFLILAANAKSPAAAQAESARQVGEYLKGSVLKSSVKRTVSEELRSRGDDEEYELDDFFRTVVVEKMEKRSLPAPKGIGKLTDKVLGGSTYFFTIPVGKLNK